MFCCSCFLILHALADCVKPMNNSKYSPCGHEHPHSHIWYVHSDRLLEQRWPWAHEKIHKGAADEKGLCLHTRDRQQEDSWAIDRWTRGSSLDTIKKTLSLIIICNQSLYATMPVNITTVNATLKWNGKYINTSTTIISVKYNNILGRTRCFFFSMWCIDLTIQL